MHLKSKRAWLLPLIMLIVSTLVVGGSLGLRLLDLDTYKDDIIASVRSSLKRDFHYQRGDFSFHYGLCFNLEGVTIKEKDARTDFIRADRLSIRIALMPLLYRKLVLTRMELERPELRVVRDRQGGFNLADLFQGAPGESPRIHGIRIRNGRIRFTDQAFPQGELNYQLAQTDLTLSHLTRGRECDFKLAAQLLTPGRNVPVALSGTCRIAPTGVRITESAVDAKIHTGFLDAGYFWPYYSRYVPFRRLFGEIALDTTFKGKLAAFRSKGSFKVARLFMEYPQVFHKELTPRLVQAHYDLELAANHLDLSSLKADVDGVKVQGSCRLSDLHSGDIRITARASSSGIDFRSFHQFIPYGVIVKDTADFIEQKIKGGIYRVDEARLDGRVSQIVHMERGQNYNVLSVKAHVEDGLLVYGPGIPTFNAIRGDLQLAGKDFLLTGMSGRFGASPLTLSGRMTDYPLPTPTSYPFTMTMQPRQQEVAWLLGRRGDKLLLNGDSTLRLSGDGTTSRFSLKGDWDLTGASYTLPGLVAKPAQRANSASFSGLFTKTDFRLNELRCQLAPLAVAATAHYRYGQGGALALDIRTNQFQLAEVAPLLPRLAPYHLSGKAQLQLQGKGSALDRLGWEGGISIAGGSLKPAEKVKPVTAVNGTLRFHGETVESSQLALRLGTSTIYGKGSLTGFDSPAVTLAFSSPLLDLADLGLNPGKAPLRGEKVQGNVTFKDGNLQIGALNFQLGRSQLALKGSVQDLEHPRLDLAVSSSHLVVEDLAPLSALSSPGQTSGSRISLKAALTAQEGKVREVPFRRLRATVMVEDGILYLQPVEASILDGELSAKLRVDPGPAGNPRYQVSYTLQRASAEKLLRALGVQKQELTGSCNLSGELTFKGETPLEFKRTALGAVKLKVERGSIRRFSVLSKVFSILNVSQLLKFQLPDMVSGGMPYKRVTGELAIKDGIVSTNNLFLDSDAINISTVGKLDLVRNELDLTIGVQPLQTVDKVVSRIPIVGWVLTGRDHSLVTTYFEAKGRLEDPKVTAVPVKSLAKGVFNIFKRVFELPARLITDTGEVIIGR